MAYGLLAHRGLDVVLPAKEKKVKQMIELALTIALALILVPIILWAGMLIIIGIITILDRWRGWFSIAAWLALFIFVSVGVTLV